MAMKLKKQEIIDRTVVLAKKKGWANTSVRDISKAIGYSTIKVYSEFGSKEDLMLEVQAQGFELLYNKYIEAIDKVTKPEKKLMAISVAHYQFSKTHRAYYEVMFNANGVSCKSPNGKVINRAGEPIRTVIEEISGSCTREKFMSWWSTLTGFVTISQQDNQSTEEEKASMLRGLIQIYLHGIVSQIFLI